MFLPYMNYTLAMQRCILAFDGPPKSEWPKTIVYDNVIYLGQRFFATYNLTIFVDRENDVFDLTITTGSNPISEKFQLLLIIGITLLVITIIFGTALWLMKSRKKRLLAD